MSKRGGDLRRVDSRSLAAGDALDACAGVPVRVSAARPSLGDVDRVTVRMNVHVHHTGRFVKNVVVHGSLLDTCAEVET